MRIDRYWKQAAAGLLAIMTLTMTGGNLDSLAMTNSQPLKAQGQMLSSPDKIIISSWKNQEELVKTSIIL